jgi:dipeptidyl aminopeptidase/acylaminoacyl peptidase
LAYADRYGKNEGGYLSNFKLCDLKTGQEEILFKDENLDYRLGWGQVLFSKDNQKLIISCDYQSQRRKNNFYLYDRQTKELRALIPEEHQVAGMGLVPGSLTENGFLYVSDKAGFDGLYWYSFTDSHTDSIVENVLQFENDNYRYGVSAEEKLFAISLAKRDSDESQVRVYKFEENKLTLQSEKNYPNAVYIQKINKSLWLYHSAFTTPPTLTKNKVDADQAEVLKIPLYRPGVEQLLDFNYEYAEYETFDGHKAPCFLTLPKGEIKAAYIVSFYGGSNYFSKAEAIFAKNGIACLSPAVRGSWEYSKEWRDLIKGDLGGAEIVDLIWGAKFLEKRLGLKPHQIGVSGGSHGGYATLRALTFPESFNGYDTRYDWGFGICAAGFADLEKFYTDSNIPDWLDDMLGSYKDNIQKYKERSPIHCFERLKTPTRIEHGTNDVRVPYSTISEFVEKLRKSDVPHDIMVKEGSGHNYSSTKEEAEVYAGEIAFIEKYTK